MHTTVYGLLLSASLASAQEHVFRTWFEAPESVMAGETFQVWMWATYEIDGVTAPSHPSLATYIRSVHASIEVSGELSAFESISPLLYDGPLVEADPGTPDGAWLRDFHVFQALGFPGVPVVYQNPMPVLTFNVQAATDATGALALGLQAPSDAGQAFLAWQDDGVGMLVATTTWGSVVPDFFAGLQAEPFTVRVIPAPGCMPMVVLAGFIGTRRRR